MLNDRAHISVSAESLERKHEAQEPRLSNPLIVIASVVFMIIFCLTSAGILIAIFSKGRPMRKMEPLGIIVAPNLSLLARFPKPNLQIDDGHAQRTALYDQQTLTLNSYGWIDQSNGIVRIPIDRAMNLILERGLPARTNFLSQTGSGLSLQLIQERPGQK